MNVETLTRPEQTTGKKTQEVVFPFPEEKADDTRQADRNKPVIMEISNIDKSYSANKKVLKDISFDIRKGEVLSIIGPSGAGKSTLLRIINRMIEPNSGAIRFQDKDTLNMKGRSLRNMRTDIA
ncbi:ATP-binding cassette domain-containing protein [Salinicoccus sp. ID82-1]|nr:ATP-binding cassette domain-containing protein [Salinicoccus sp. ID82-1]